MSQGSATLLASCVKVPISHSAHVVNFVFMSLEDLCLAVPIATLSAHVSLRSFGIQASTNCHLCTWNFKDVGLPVDRLIHLRTVAILNTYFSWASLIDRVPDEVLFNHVMRIYQWLSVYKISSATPQDVCTAKIFEKSHSVISF